MERRRRQTKRAIEQNLACGGEQQIRAANDFGDLHGGVIDDDGELISGNVVLTPDDKIAEVFSSNELLRPKMAVDE